MLWSPSTSPPSTLRLVPGPEWGKVSLLCQILLATAQPFRSIEIIGRSYFFPQASCLHFIMCIVLDPLQKEKWPFMVSTECGQKLDQADRTPHRDGKYSRRTPTLHAERGRGQRAAALGPANRMHRRPLLLLLAASRWTPPHQGGEGKAGQAGGLLAPPSFSLWDPCFSPPLGGAQ